MTFKGQDDYKLFFKLGATFIGVHSRKLIQLPQYSAWFYKNIMFWSDKNALYYFTNNYIPLLLPENPHFHCYIFYKNEIKYKDCNDHFRYNTICETVKSEFKSNANKIMSDNATSKTPNIKLKNVMLINTLQVYLCQNNEYTKTFLVFDETYLDKHIETGIEMTKRFCFQRLSNISNVDNDHILIPRNEESRDNVFLHQMPMFRCASSHMIPYTLVCDHRAQCPDRSDEDPCYFDPCPFNMFQCSSGECVSLSSYLNKVHDCFDLSDEMTFKNRDKSTDTQFDFYPPPSMVSFDGVGFFTTERLLSSSDCPSTHFLCHDDLCLPVYLICNGVTDCREGEDEVDCDSYTCPGYYRCYRSVQ